MTISYKEKFHTVDLLPKWSEFNCDMELIDEHIDKIEFWYEHTFDRQSDRVWVWKYDPEFEYVNAGIVGIVFNNDDDVEQFKWLFL
jgi:hypothetical protein